jgi:hypothetical protein
MECYLLIHAVHSIRRSDSGLINRLLTERWHLSQKVQGIIGADFALQRQIANGVSRYPDLCFSSHAWNMSTAQSSCSPLRRKAR